MKETEIKAALQARLDQNYAKMLDAWRLMAPDELIGLAEEVAAVQMIHAQLLSAASQEDMTYLLRFADPLLVVSDTWLEENGAGMVHDDEISHALWTVNDRQTAELDYDLVPDFSGEEAAETLAPPQGPVMQL